MNNLVEISSIVEDMKVFKKYYTNARLVDPLLNRVVNITNNSYLIVDDESNGEICFKIWNSGHVCENCISYRAVLENDTFVKFEEVDNKIYMITALPVRVSNRVLALELYKDVAKSDILESLLIQNADVEGKAFDFHSSITRLNELVIRDALTDVYNRRYINEKLPIEMIKASTEKIPMSLIMADIDYFKKINDNYGHGVGDEVLKAFTGVLTTQTESNKESWVARYGGEEFLICMLNCNKQRVLETAERLRSATEKQEIITATGNLNITASFGVYTYLEEDISADRLLNMVDNNLYLAKKSGRNCVIAN